MPHVLQPFVITVSPYSREEDFSEADIVLATLGDPGVEKCQVPENRMWAKPSDYFTRLSILRSRATAEDGRQDAPPCGRGASLQRIWRIYSYHEEEK
jgi:hypothetical protein